MNEKNLSLSIIYQTLNYKGLMRFHQIREIVEFLYSLKIWRIIWKSYNDGNNKSKDNDKNENNNNNTNNGNFDILAFSDSEDEYESDFDENGNKIVKKKKKSDIN